MRESYALLIIDMQKAYFHNEALEREKVGLVATINELVRVFSKDKLPVFSVITMHDPDGSTWTLNMKDDKEGYLFEGHPDTEVVDGLLLGEVTTITKTRDSAFWQTDLVKQLTARHITTLVIVGVSTHSCIMLTAADAYAENFRVILVSDAIASHDPSFHEPAFALLRQEYRQRVLSSSDTVQLVDG